MTSLLLVKNLQKIYSMLLILRTANLQSKEKEFILRTMPKKLKNKKKKCKKKKKKPQKNSNKKNKKKEMKMKMTI